MTLGSSSRSIGGRRATRTRVTGETREVWSARSAAVSRSRELGERNPVVPVADRLGLVATRALRGRDTRRRSSRLFREKEHAPRS